MEPTCYSPKRLAGKKIINVSIPRLACLPQVEPAATFYSGTSSDTLLTLVQDDIITSQLDGGKEYYTLISVCQTNKLFAISHNPATHAKIIFHFSHIVTNAQQRWSIHNIVLSILAKQVDGAGEAIESHKKDSLIQQKPGASSEPASSSSSFSYTSARGTQQFII